jgi:hypothetical protein
VLKAEVKRPLGKPTDRWKDNVKPNIKEIWQAVVEWFIGFRKIYASL